MKTYKAATITLEFPENLFDPLDRETAEHIIKCFLEEDKTYQNYPLEDQHSCLDKFLNQVKQKGSCWSIV